MFVRIEYFVERRKEMFYLTTHSTHFIYGYMMSDIWQRTTQIAKEEPCRRHMDYSFRLFCMHHLTDRITHTTAFLKPVVDYWLEREIAQWVHHEGSIRRPIAPWANALTTELHLAPRILYELINYACQHQPFVPDCWSVYDISLFSHNILGPYGTVPFSLQPIPDSTVLRYPWYF